MILPRLGRWEDARTAAERAFQMLDGLASSRPALFEKNLASALTNLGMTLDREGRPEEATAATRRAVKVLRSLAQVNPARFEPNLAAALNNLSADLDNLKRRPEALAASEEAVEIRRRLATANPAAFEGDLADALSNLALIAVRDGIGQSEQALAALREAIEIYTRLARSGQHVVRPDLARAWTLLGATKSRLGQYDAVAAADIATAMFRQLAANDPATFERDLAWSLWTSASIRVELPADLSGALAAAEESTALYARLSEDQPDLASQLFSSISMLADVLDRLGRNVEAEDYRRLLPSIVTTPEAAPDGCPDEPATTHLVYRAASKLAFRCVRNQANPGQHEP